MAKLPTCLTARLGMALILASFWPGHSRAQSGDTMVPNAQQLIDSLGLEAHVEGGYYRRTFQADHRPRVATEQGERYTLTSIYYLLSESSPIGHWHLNRSDILHYYHLGAPITYHLIHPDGRYETVVMGPDPTQGQQLQLVVRGGIWKASELPAGAYGLISEAVAPGFDFADMTLGERATLLKQFPRHRAVIERLTRSPGDENRQSLE